MKSVTYDWHGACLYIGVGTLFNNHGEDMKMTEKEAGRKMHELYQAAKKETDTKKQAVLFEQAYALRKYRFMPIVGVKK